jgi:SMI1 / KNR4 family (SUKH-1)
MNEKIKYYLSRFEKNDNIILDNTIESVQQQIDFKLPKDYLDVIKEINGGEGEIGNNGWLKLYPLERVIQVNINYRLLMQQIPDFFLFGKDAADTGYAFHKQEHTYHSFGLMSDFNTDFITFCGNTFEDFLKYLYNQ